MGRSSLINEYYVLKTINDNEQQQNADKSSPRVGIFPKIFGALMVSPIPDFSNKSQISISSSENSGENVYQILNLSDIAVNKENGKYSLKAHDNFGESFARDNSVVILFMSPFLENASQITQ